MASFENYPTPESLPSLGFLGQSFATSPEPRKRPPEAISRDKQQFEVLRASGDVVKRWLRIEKCALFSVHLTLNF